MGLGDEPPTGSQQLRCWRLARPAVNGCAATTFLADERLIRQRYETLNTMDIKRGTDDAGRRWYVRLDDGEIDTLGMSVTQVMSLALEEDKTGLHRWQARNDGEGDSMHHEHIFWYSGPRGTLAHYRCLNPLADRELWGAEESESALKLQRGPSDDAFEDASTDPTDVAYSVMVNHDIVSQRDTFDALFAADATLQSLCDDDLAWVESAFDSLTDAVGFEPSDAIAVEQYLYNGSSPELPEGIGYGGQCDLLYRDADGDVVIADLKTSSSLRQKHRLQGVAYANAVEQAEGLPDSVDRIEVWRMCPDEPEWEVHTNRVPERLADNDRVTEDGWYVDPWGDFAYGSDDDMWHTFVDVVGRAHDGVPIPTLDELTLAE